MTLTYVFIVMVTYEDDTYIEDVYSTEEAARNHHKNNGHYYQLIKMEVKE